MSKKAHTTSGDVPAVTEFTELRKLGTQDYDKALCKLHVELVKLQ